MTGTVQSRNVTVFSALGSNGSSAGEQRQLLRKPLSLMCKEQSPLQSCKGLCSLHDDQSHQRATVCIDKRWEQIVEARTRILSFKLLLVQPIPQHLRPKDWNQNYPPPSLPLTPSFLPSIPFPTPPPLPPSTSYALSCQEAAPAPSHFTRATRDRRTRRTRGETSLATRVVSTEANNRLIGAHTRHRSKYPASPAKNWSSATGLSLK